MKLNSLFICFPFIFFISWILGLDQLLVLPFTLFCYVIYQIKYQGQLVLTFDYVSRTFLFIGLIGLFSLDHVTNYGLWTKLTFTFLFASIYYSLLHSIGIKLTKEYVLDFLNKGMFYLTLLVLFFTAIFLIVPSFKFNTILSSIFPSGSHFFESMKVHSLSSIDIDYESINSIRYSGLFISYSSMSMASILLMGVIGSYERLSIYTRLLLVTSLLITSMLTQSRLGILSSLFVYAVIIYSIFLRKYLSKIGPKYTIILAGLILSVLAVLFNDIIINIYNDIVFGMRSNSAHTRMRIYEASISGILENPLFGLGHSNPIDFSSQRFSAGTHSSYLAIGYQRGLIAAFLYFLMMTTMLLISLKNMWITTNTSLRILSATFIGFFVRESLDTWWWDALLFFTVINFLIIFKFKNEKI